MSKNSKKIKINKKIRQKRIFKGRHQCSPDFPICHLDGYCYQITDRLNINPKQYERNGFLGMGFEP